MRNNFWIMIHLRIIIQRSSRTNSQSTKFVNICKNSLWDHSSSHLFMICENSPFPCLLTINWTHCLTSISNLVKIPIPYLEFIHPTRCESSSSQKKKKKKKGWPRTRISSERYRNFFLKKRIQEWERRVFIAGNHSNPLQAMFRSNCLYHNIAKMRQHWSHTIHYKQKGGRVRE